MIENEMNQAESRARKNRNGPAADRMANAARLGVLEKFLKIPVKRYRDPGGGNIGGPFKTTVVDSAINKENKDMVVRVKAEGGEDDSRL